MEIITIVVNKVINQLLLYIIIIKFAIVKFFNKVWINLLIIIKFIIIIITIIKIAKIIIINNLIVIIIMQKIFTIIIVTIIKKIQKKKELIITKDLVVKQINRNKEENYFPVIKYSH